MPFFLPDLIMPCPGLVVDDGCAEAPRRADARARDGDGGQVHREPDRQGSHDLQDHQLFSSSNSPSIYSAQDIKLQSASCTIFGYRYVASRAKLPGPWGVDRPC